MPSLSIDVNGSRVATIDLARLQVASVSAHGALDHAPGATLDAFGGNYGDGESGHLIWIAEHALLPGDVLRVGLDALCDGADPGRTMAELYPDAEPGDRTDFTIDAAMAAELRARPRLQKAFVVQAATSTGQQAMAASDERHTDFRFGLTWDRFRPDQARIWFGTYCLDDVLAREVGTEHLRTAISLGDSASFSVTRADPVSTGAM